jgi:hypothetical protein
MNKQICMAYVCLIFANTVFSQVMDIDYRFKYFSTPNPKTELTFSQFSPGKSNVNFEFFNLTNNTKFNLELSSAQQVYRLPNIDSILEIALQNLKPFVDSFKQDGIVRRIDYVSNTTKPQIRIIEHSSIPNNYIVDAGKISQLKIEQDTLRIKAFTTMYSATMKKDIYIPFFITLLANNFSNLYSLPNNPLASCIQLLKNNMPEEKISKNRQAIYFARFNMKENKLFNPIKADWIGYNKQNKELVPNVYAGLQYLQGQWSTSFAAGLRYTYGSSNISKQHVYAMWEPYFIFNNGNAFRNDFITLRYTEVEKNAKTSFDYVANFSISYLAKQRGNFFYDNTFKLGLPGARSGWLQFEPEIIFTNFFKNFSPGLRLTIHYE